MTMRWLAQDAISGEWIATELRFADVQVQWDLSGAGSFQGTLKPEQAYLAGPTSGEPRLQIWKTLLFMEEAGQIRWGGILVQSTFTGEEWKLEASGFSTYPHGMPYEGDYSKINIDPAQVVKDLWAAVQDDPYSRLGVTVTGSTTARLGTDTTSGKVTPYELHWVDTPDIGQEIDDLTSQTPFDWVERHAWTDAHKTAISHTIEIGYPRIGRKRSDLRFMEGENIIAEIDPALPGDGYSNAVFAVGAGEGKKALRSTSAVPDGRLRRVAILDAKDVASQSRLDSMARRKLAASQALFTIDSITIRNHPNAPFGSFQCGDDIVVRAHRPWVGSINLWCRITSIVRKQDGTCTLSLKRSDSYTYGG